jgi:hypothetical protein
MNLNRSAIFPFVSLIGALACGSNNHSGVSNVGSNGPSVGPGGGSVGKQTPGGPSDLIVPTDADASVATGGGQSNCDGGECACASDNTTTIEGYVFDPAGKNPLYNVSVYVPDPASPLPNLDTVPLACGCTQLFPAKVRAMSAPTDATGHFKITCAPSGMVSLVVQTGKWRRQYDGIAVSANRPNTVANLRLPANSSEGSLPNIAIATGASDSFECLPLRLGVSASEYVVGSAVGGHIHIYTGYRGAALAAGSVEAYLGLWDQPAHLNEHDVVILSCEGQETTGGTPGAPLNAANQSSLMSYANAGGRVFASHFQYAWFSSGPFATGANSIATWTTGAQHIDDTRAFPADIDTTLVAGASFPAGSALAQWLNLVGALTANQLPIWFARNNVQALLRPPSTEWIHLDPSVLQAPSATQYFSVDTPIGAGDGAVCGRVVYSDLHVSGGPGMNAPGVPPDYPNLPGQGAGRGRGGAAQFGIVPTQCAAHPLTPQEEALEFMLFDLSSCLVPIGQSPPRSIVK